MQQQSPPTQVLRDLYARMLLARQVDDRLRQLFEQGYSDFFASCQGHEAAQVGSASCIEVGIDFTLPYYRDLGVVLTVGMTPYEVFRTSLRTHLSESTQPAAPVKQTPDTTQHWGYYKHNTVTGSAPVATQILHAAGIAFACKLRKATAATVVYCGDGATTEPDFLEGLRFAALHHLPVICICEQDCTQSSQEPFAFPSCMTSLALPEGLTHQHIDGSDIIAVYNTMHAAMQQARAGQGPILLELSVTRPTSTDNSSQNDPLSHCQRLLQEQGGWDDAWATQLHERLDAEIERAVQDAMKDKTP